MNTRDDFRKADWFANWKVLLIFAVLSFAFAFGLRAMELPKWDNPSFMVDGEYIMGTHDAYAWLAGVKGVGKAATNPMSILVKMLGSITGAQYGNIAFWLPAVFAGFTAMAAFAWGLLTGGPWIGFCAGVYATSIPMFLFRTRLSYYDTDLVTLLFPLIISFLMARWISWGIRSSWLPGDSKVESFRPQVWQYLLPVVGGICVSFGRQWHGDVFLFGLYTLFASLFLVFLCGTKENRPVLLEGLTYFCVTAMLGWIGAVLSIACIGFLLKNDFREHRIYKKIYFYLLVMLAAVLFSDTGMQLYYLGEKVLSYLKPVADAAEKSVAQIHYPGIAQSVIEAQNISFEVLFNNLTGNMYLSGFGLVGFLFLLVRRP
ncbi:MAG: STT3 domain-containing protein, partial [Spirochaetales bacterium]|nr:STT3 domain-containing protein [Spirochaetales bacterium]